MKKSNKMTGYNELKAWMEENFGVSKAETTVTYNGKTYTGQMDVRTIYQDMINKITTNGVRTTSCLAAATIANLYGLEGLNALEDAGLITYAGQNSNNYAVYVIA